MASDINYKFMGFGGGFESGNRMQVTAACSATIKKIKRDYNIDEDTNIIGSNVSPVIVMNYTRAEVELNQLLDVVVKGAYFGNY